MITLLRVRLGFIYFVESTVNKGKSKLWVLVNSTGKISDGYIRDLGFNPHLQQKLIVDLVWW